MNTDEAIDHKTQRMLESLQKVAAATLERKRRLGHYAVLWKNGKVVLEGEDAPEIKPTTDSPDTRNRET